MTYDLNYYFQRFDTQLRMQSMKSTQEDIELWHKSGEELFKHGKEIMGLEPSFLACALCTALAMTLVTSSGPRSLEDCTAIRETIFETISLEINRLATKVLLNLLKDAET